MPLLDSSYRPPWPFRHGHVQTIYTGLFRSVDDVTYERERLDTPDGDFLDVDWSRVGAHRVAILSHGLEGSTESRYIRGMARALNRNGWDVLAWNCRGCSGEVNRLPRSYHSGATEDLHEVVVAALRDYGQAVLLGFSLGGNLTLKYVGEREEDLDSRICAAAVFSVPCDLAAGSDQLARPANAVYMRRFMSSLCRKILDKAALLPEGLDTESIHRLRTFHDFDDRYTAPLHGFSSAEDYWRRCSSLHFLDGIRIPTLLVNAEDDPFLPPSCYPVDVARRHPHLFLCTPRYGGHIGFVPENGSASYWSEDRAVSFLEDVVPGYRITPLRSSADSLESPVRGPGDSHSARRTQRRL